MIALMTTAGIDLEWADGQYWTTLFDIIKNITILRTPKKKEKVSASKMAQFIR